MVFTFGVMALLDLFGGVFTPLPQESTDGLRTIAGRLGRVAGPASPRDTAHFTSMVFTLGVCRQFGGFFGQLGQGCQLISFPGSMHDN